MTLAELVRRSNAVAATRARNEKIALLAETLEALAPDEVTLGVAMLSGRAPGGTLGVGPAAIEQALRRSGPRRARSARATKRARAEALMLPLFGDVAETARHTGAKEVPATPLTLADVGRALEAVASAGGAGSSRARADELSGLFDRVGEGEKDFLARLLLGDLRQGALSGLMEEAVARASRIPLARVRRAAMLAGDLGVVAAPALAEGETALERFRLELFRPLRPMLAQPAQNLDDALTRLGEAAFEAKLDGARVQVHRRGDEVRVYSRLLNDVTKALPEVVELARSLPLAETVLDGEVVALDPAGRPLPFQDTMRRFGRRLEVEAVRAGLPLSTVFFDVLHLDGEDTFDLPERERHARLEARVAGALVPRVVTADREVARAFYEQALHEGHEGVMAKALDAPYAAGARGAAWLKVKRAHTLDLVVLAVEWGSGRRSGWLSNIHLGARDEEHGGFVMLGKTFKGMTDEMLAWQTKVFGELATASEGGVVRLRPEIVVEVEFSDVQRSSRYPGGMALRLARVVRYRPDKTPLEADTVDTVRRLVPVRAL